MHVRFRRGLTIVYLALAAVLLTWALDQTRLFRLIALKAADFHYLAVRPHVPDQITLIVADRKTMDAFSEPRLFWHRYYAEAIEAAASAGARVLGLDLAFPVSVEKYAPGMDQRLAGAFIDASSLMPVICAHAGASAREQLDGPVPLNMAAAALGATAFVNLTADEDDFIRSIELVEPGAGNQPRMKSMALAMAEKYLGRPVGYPSRLMIIRYAGPGGTMRRVSLVDFLQAARAGKSGLLRSWVAGKAVLLGADDLADRYATPYYAFRAGAPANTMGVEIHASALNTLLSGRFLQQAPLPVRLALMLLVALAASTATMRTAGWPLLAWHAALSAGVVLGTHAAFLAGWLVPVFSLLAASALAFVLSLVARFLTVARNRNSLRKAMRLFVGEEVAEAVEKTGSVGLTGRREFVTVLFGDIRGFTAFSETNEPETVVERLNEYLSAMTALIVRHGGAVNKYIGDGVLAVFSGTDSVGESHASRAVRCAMDMVATSSLFETRAGIYTGYVIVGNIGSSDKLEYTVLGDTVNLASRLEGLNKEFSTNILFGATTFERLGPDLAARWLGDASVKGRSESVTLYTVAGGDTE